MISNAYFKNFLGHTPSWYKWTIILFLICNPILYLTVGPVITGWVVVLEFIFTLAMALKCYPLLPGGLIALQSVFIGLTSTKTIYHEIENAFEVILLLIFMVAGIYFLKNMLLFIFTKIVLNIRSKVFLSLLFCFISAILSAFLDALTVIAVIISISVGFYGIYHRVASGKKPHHDHDHTNDQEVEELNRDDLRSFRSFLRSLLMHAAIGTALGGVCTIVGEPQNLLIASKAGWNFTEFLLRMSPITIPVLIMGLITCGLLEITGWFGYGEKLPANVKNILKDFDDKETKNRTDKDRAEMVIQAVTFLWLVIALSLHLASVGLIGLSVIVIATSFRGINEEHRIGKAFEEALPFTALLTVFFVIVAVIEEQSLFAPVISYALSLQGNTQVLAFYGANGLLSMISDNVFVATIYIKEIHNAFLEAQITRESFDSLAVAINVGTNIPSVATPNGQAAFLFLLTSSVAPVIRLSYGRMVYMALPYTIILSITGFLSIMHFLQPGTEYLKEIGMINVISP